MKNYQNTAARRMPGDNRRQIRSMVQTAIFGAIIVIMAFTPFLGYIPLGFTRATDLQEPRLSTSPLYWRPCSWDPKKERAWDFFSVLPVSSTTL